MADTNFVRGTVVEADWLQDVNDLTYNFTQSGTGAVPRAAQDKMREVVSLKDFGAVGDGVTNDKSAIDLKNTSGTVVFLAGATYAYTGTFTPVAKFFGGSIVDSNRTWDFSSRTTESNARIIQGRGRINYNTSTSVSVCVPENIVMAGFRFMGSYKKGQGRVMPSGATSGKVVVNDSTNLAIESSIKPENWYAVFAVCNNSSSAVSYVNMPFFRAGTPSGSVIPLAAGGESSGDTITPITYTGLSTNELVGAEVLVIQEGKVFSGRTTTVTANTNGSVTLANAGSMVANDFFLVAPPGWDHYVYLGSWYRDTGEPRNMADTGTLVGSYGVDLIGLATAGAVSLTRFPCAGQVSPLATAALYQLTYTLSTASTGTAAHYVYMDSSTHYTASFYNQKTSGSSETYQGAVSKMPFSFEQALWINTAGSLESSIAGRTLRLYGWVEP